MQTPDNRYSTRQAQWNAFNVWKSRSRPVPISLEQRITWYAEAFTLTRSVTQKRTPEDIRRRVQWLGEVRNRLAGLSNPHDHV
jgi:hypothetical protein